MSTSELSDIRRDVGNLREAVGQLRGEMHHTRDLLIRIDKKIEENRATHRTLGDRVDDIRTRLDVGLGESQTRRRVAEWGRSLTTGSLAALAVNWFVNWVRP